MYWQSRILDRGADYEDEFERFQLVEVYFNEDDSLIGYAGSPGITGYSVEDLREELEYLSGACDKDPIPIQEFNLSPEPGEYGYETDGGDEEVTPDEE